MNRFDGMAMLALLIGLTTIGCQSGAQRPGPLSGGRYLLPNGWIISPAGRQLDLGGLPLKLVQVPHSPYVVVTSNGYTDNFVAMVDARTEQVVHRVPIKQGFLGLAVSPDGKQVYASGAADDVIHLYTIAKGKLMAGEPIKLAKSTYPAGLALNRAGDRLYVTGNNDNQLHKVDLKTAAVIGSFPVGTSPYACAISSDEKTAYVSNWGEDSVAVVDLSGGPAGRTIKVQDHPNDLLLTPDEKRLFVANGNRNTVSVIDTATSSVIEQIDVALAPNAPLGSTPNALAIDAAGTTLFVANADNNALALIDVSKPGRSAGRGFIPTGWYPTAVTLVDGGRKLVIANGKGSMTKPNAEPWTSSNANDRKNPGYIGHLLEGTLSFVDAPDASAMARYSQQVHRNSPFSSGASVAPTVPFPLGDDCPIRYVFYIIKENRTYDQIFGDMKEGNGDPKYCFFPEDITPNHHALARQFVLFDNFYHDAEVSADGHHWVNSAYATDYVEKLWPNYYAGRRGPRKDFHDDPVAFSKGGFMWDLCQKAGVTYRTYGEFARIRGAEPGKVKAAIPSLEGHFHPTYFGSDGIAAMSDSKRLELWLEDFRQFEKAGEMPRYQVLSLPGDHTLATSPGRQTPRAMMAENDLALGKIVEAISQSRFWPRTAIFVIEDDAQNGPDHVDCHRSIALIVSPYTRRQYVDSTMYSSSSMLRTMELILGLPPLTQYDASATPMWNSFQGRPVMQPYAALAARVPLQEKNTTASYGAQQSLALELEEADTVPDDVLNEILWKAIMGPESTVPARRVGAFVWNRHGDDDD